MKLNELRLKNALRCQFDQGKMICKECPYFINGNDCNIAKISSDAIDYIKTAEQLIGSLQDELAKFYEK